MLTAIRGIGKQVTQEEEIIRALKEQRLNQGLDLFYQEMKQLGVEKEEVLEKLQKQKW